MIRINGEILPLINSGTLNQSGDPESNIPVWGEPIPCNIRPLKQNERGVYVDGKFTISSFEILIDMQEFTAKRIKVKNTRNGFEEEFQVQQIEFLDFVKRVKITV